MLGTDILLAGSYLLNCNWTRFSQCQPEGKSSEPWKDLPQDEPVYMTYMS
jgi:hypothetical protein